MKTWLLAGVLSLAAAHGDVTFAMATIFFAMIDSTLSDEDRERFLT